MRKLVFSLAIISPILVNAQYQEKVSTSVINTSAKKVEYNNRTNFPAFISFQKNNAPVAISDANLNTWAKSIFPLRNEDELAYKSNHLDKITNQNIYEFQQKYQNIPVEFAVVNVIQADGKIQNITGDYYANLTPVNSINITTNQALAFAKTAVPAEEYKWDRKAEEAAMKVALNKPDFSYDPKTTLVLLPINTINGKEFKYAYKLDVFTHKPLSRYNVYIDAQTGEVLKKVSTTCAIDVKSPATTRYIGAQSIQSDSIAPNNFVLRENNRRGRGMQIETRNSQTLFEFDAVDFTSATKNWSMANLDRDDAALDCHHAAESTYDYYYDTLGHNSFDGAGGKMLQYVHYDLNYFNAFWTGSYSCYGDGNGEPLTYIDVVGHELTHGVTQYTAGLNYESESGALNESFSDIFGTVIEFFRLGNAASWNIGTRSFTLRDMSNPNRFNNPDTYGGVAWTNTVNCVPDGNNDYCGVHNNSGVQNFWFYLLSVGDTGVNDLKNPYEVVGIGMSKAAKIAFKSLRDYLTPESDYADARRGSVQAAIDLYGQNSQEVQSVMNAWHAVGVGKRFTFLPDIEFKVAQVICAPNSTIQFVNNTGNGLTYHWDFGDGASSTDENPSHAYATIGDYDVRLIATNVNGSDTLLKPGFVKVFTDSPIPSNCAVNMLTPVGTTGIYRVEFGGIDNSSAGPKDENPYMDFNCYRATIARSAYHPMKITTHSSSPVFTRVYIDWNNNGNFDVPEELAMSTNNTLQYHYDTVYVPSTAVPNTPLRMRVVSAKATNNTPDVVCSGLRNGQIEDYSVIVTTGAGVSTENKSLFSVYPNPAQNELFIKSSEGYHQLSVLDVLGREMMNSNFNSSTRIDLSNFPNGIYLVKVETNGKVQAQRVVKKN